jgi:anthranilate synthase component I
MFATLIARWESECPLISDGNIEPGGVWNALRSLCQCLRPAEATALGFLASFAFDTAWQIEKLPRRIRDDWTDIPDIVFTLHRGIIRFDLSSGNATLHQFLVSDAAPFYPGVLEEGLDPLGAESPPDAPQPHKTLLTMTKEVFLEAASRALEHIARGDIYQVQLGCEVQISSPIKPLDVYARLRAINPSPYTYFAPIGALYAIGASPELFVRKEGSEITMRPIAGTMRRTGNQAADLAAAAVFAANEKERAEHLMLVDLGRNDFSKVCKTGTLKVEELMHVDRYSHVFHLVSTIRAQLDDKYDVFDLIVASFPAGTMTGAPKIRATEIIESLEVTRRGLYAGALGLLQFNGDAVLALCIRAAMYRDGEYAIRASAGVVADSNPASEWEEIASKLAAARIAIAGSELKAML